MKLSRFPLVLILPLTLAATLAAAQTTGGSAAPAASAPAPAAPAPTAAQPATAPPPTAQPLPSNSTPAAPSTLSTQSTPQNSAPAAPPVGLPSNPSANQGVRDPNAPVATTLPPAAPNAAIAPNPNVAPNTTIAPSPAVNPNTATSTTGTATPDVTLPTAPLPGSAITGTPQPRPTRSESLTALDRNRDNYISAEELAGNTLARSVVADCDTDRDGKIASYEYSACVANNPNR